MSQSVRVRFAPSPTGPLHIGGVRTALFNYLFAKKHKGTFVLRIEDTDQSRYVPGAENYIIEALSWLNIPFDEGPNNEGAYGPYRQSERKEIYKNYVQQLLDTNKAYYAFDTPEELQLQRENYEKEGKTFIYNWHNRNTLSNSLVLSKEEVEAKIASGTPYVVRFKMVENGDKENTLSTTDLVRGTTAFNLNLLDDKVLFKSDGMPTYHLANIVDDHLMEISHVIRGEEWLPSLPLHISLYQALNWTAPQFAHLPLIMKPVGKGKLSKRDGDKMGFPVFPLEWKTQQGEVFSGYREDGYLPDAVVNMLALLGWNPGTEQELFSLSELIQQFDIERVNKSGAKFDPEKTKWFQNQYLQQLDSETLVAQFSKYLQQKQVNIPSNIAEITEIIKERATFIPDLWDQGNFFFEAPTSFNEKAAKKAFKEGTSEILEQVLTLIESTSVFTSENLSTTIKEWITNQEIGFGKVMMPLRLALVGEMKGPDVFDIAALLGKEETCNRLKFAIEFLH